MAPRLKLVRAAVAVVLALPAGVGAQNPTPAVPAPATGQPAAMTETRADALKWAPLDLPGFPPGLQSAALTGDPAQAAPYTLRLRFPSGYKYPAHWHPGVENITVVSGRFLLGMGDNPDRGSTRAYGPGDFLMIPPRMSHFGSVEGETIVQLHGMGPFQVTVVQPAAAAKP